MTLVRTASWRGRGSSLTVVDRERRGRSTHFQKALSQERIRPSTSREVRKSPISSVATKAEPMRLSNTRLAKPWGLSGLLSASPDGEVEAHRGKETSQGYMSHEQ